MPGKCSLQSGTESKVLRKDCPCPSRLLKPKEILRSDLGVLETDLTTHEIKDTRTPNLKL